MREELDISRQNDSKMKEVLQSLVSAGCLRNSTPFSLS